MLCEVGLGGLLECPGRDESRKEMGGCMMKRCMREKDREKLEGMCVCVMYTQRKRERGKERGTKIDGK
jgi:hypothetical protein